MQDDDELDEVRVSLLPKGFFALAKQVVQKGCDSVGQGVAFEIVVKRIVSPLGIQADFDVVADAASLQQDIFNLAAKVALNFKHQRTRFCIRICCPIAQQLVRERIHAASRLSATGGTNHDCAGKQSALWDDEPSGVLRGNWKTRVVNFAYNDAELIPRFHNRIEWQWLWFW